MFTFGIVDFRNFYQKHVGAQINCLINEEDNSEFTRPLLRPIYIGILNYFPFFINKFIFDRMLSIDYIYETDNIVKVSNEKTSQTLVPIIMSLELIDFSTNDVKINLKELSKNYSNDIPIDYILKNEFLKLDKSEHKIFFLSFQIYEIIFNDDSYLTTTQRKLKESILSSYLNENLEIKIKTLKNAIPTVETFKFKDYKNCSKLDLINLMS